MVICKAFLFLAETNRYYTFFLDQTLGVRHATVPLSVTPQLHNFSR